MEPSNEYPSRDYLLLSLLGMRNNAPPHAWDYLSVRDRMKLLLVSKTMHQHLKEIEYSHCKDGILYRVPFPGFPGLLQNASDNAGLFPHQLASLQAMHKAENSDTHFGALRGGILADAPGLGKTITMLAMISATAGKRPRTPPEFWNPEQIAEGWKCLSQSGHFTSEILKALAPFRPLVDLHRDLVQQTKPPLPLDKFPTIRAFESFVQKSVKDCATETEMEEFRQNILQLKTTLDKSHRKILKGPSGRRMVWERSLVPTSATIMVVPDALLEHWFQQIHEHLYLQLFADEEELVQAGGRDNGEPRGVVYIDGVGDIADARMPLGDMSVHSMDMLPPWELSKYMVVITTFSRCQRELRKEAACGRMNWSSSKRKRSNEEGGNISNASESQSSPLLRTRWLRLVVDEGHELANNGSNSNELTYFINQIAAERRWVISGTPTTGDESKTEYSSEALDQLQRLLLFLRHPVYGSMPASPDDQMGTSPYFESSPSAKEKATQRDKEEQARERWVTEIKEPFLQKQQSGRNHLLSLLREVMVFHKKEDIHLPKPIFRQIEVDISIPDDVQDRLRQDPKHSYIELKKYLGGDDFQSLVDEAQGDYIVKATRNAKKALATRGGPLKEDGKAAIQMVAAKDINESNEVLLSKDRRPIKAVVYSSEKFNLRDVTEVLYKSLERENIAEAYDDPRFDCGSELSRFRHGLKECRDCPICGFRNDVNSNRRKAEPHCQNTLLEVVSIEDPATRFLIERERVVRAIPTDQGGNVERDRLEGATNAYSDYGKMNAKRWRLGDLLEVDIRDPHPLLKKRESFDTWRKYGMEKCVELAQGDNFRTRDWFFGPMPVLWETGESPDKRIPVRFMKARLAKWQHCSGYHNPSRWYLGPRLAHVPVQTIEENVFVLTLDAGLSHGLDLSFVTHIFLLEPVEDAAVLEQITSRAHRLGATGPVVVETVNTFWKLDADTEAVLAPSKIIEEEREKRIGATSFKKGSASLSIKDKDSSLLRTVCQYCYRPFASLEIAVEHEQKTCPRNPANADIVDPWRLSSMYREIRPPPPPEATRRSVQREEE